MDGLCVWLGVSETLGVDVELALCVPVPLPEIECVCVCEGVSVVLCEGLPVCVRLGERVWDGVRDTLRVFDWLGVPVVLAVNDCVEVIVIDGEPVGVGVPDAEGLKDVVEDRVCVCVSDGDTELDGLCVGLGVPETLGVDVGLALCVPVPLPEIECVCVCEGVSVVLCERLPDCVILGDRV